MNQVARRHLARTPLFVFGSAAMCARARRRRIRRAIAIPVGLLSVGIAAYGLVLPKSPEQRSPTLDAGAPTASMAWDQRERPKDPYLGHAAERPQGERRSTLWERDGYRSIQVNVDSNGYNIVGDAANEPSIAVDPTDPHRIVIGWRQFDNVASDFRQAGWAYSHTGGETWVFSGVLEPGVFRSDPVLGVSPEGVFYYYSLKTSPSYACDLFRSIDGGISWLPGVPAQGGDKPWMVVDATWSPRRGFIYANWKGSLTVSVDGGDSFGVVVALPGNPSLGTSSVGPTGVLYVCGASTGGATVVRNSDEQGPNWLEFDRVDVSLGGSPGGAGDVNPDGLLGQPWIAASHSRGPDRGYVYLLSSVHPFGYTDPADVVFVRSTDEGLTWSDPVKVNSEPAGAPAWQWFGTMSVAPNGRIDAVWYDTQSDPLGNTSEVYYAFSADAGVTWSTGIPVSPPFDHRLGYPGGNEKLGDYIHMVSDNTGANLAYAATFNGEQDVYYLRIGAPLGDCNTNGVEDETDIAGGTSLDDDHDGTPDECQPVWYVDASAPPGGNGNSWDEAFSDVQDALDVAQYSDAVWIADGTYTPSRLQAADDARSAAFELGGVRLFGGFSGGEVRLADRDVSTNRAILTGDLLGNDLPDGSGRGENCYHVVVARNGPATGVLDGITVTGGNADGVSEDGTGGGIQIVSADVTVRDCTFIDNQASNGGGISVELSESSFVGCRFKDNRAVSAGGGLYAYKGTVSMVGCSIDSNGGDDGAGIACVGSQLVAFNTVWSSNDATRGGGVYIAGIPGGRSASPVYSAVTLANCTILNNAADTGGGVYLGSLGDAMIRNTLLWYNSDITGNTETSQVFFSDAAPTIGYCCVQGWSGALGGTGNTGADPNIVDAAGGDYRLQAPSSAIDAGSNGALPADVVTDLAGGARFVDHPLVPDTGVSTNGLPVVDMGAYEWFDPDCNSNGAEDVLDIVGGTSADCNSNGVPDECDSDFDADGIPDDCDDDADGDGVLDIIDFCPFSPLGVPVNPFGGPMGDLDDDCLVTLDDYFYFEICLYLSGPASDPGFQDCRGIFDFDGDGDVDLADFAAFMRALTRS